MSYPAIEFTLTQAGRISFALPNSTEITENGSFAEVLINMEDYVFAGDNKMPFVLALVNWQDGLATLLSSLDTQIYTLQSELSTANNQISSLQSQVTSLEAQLSTAQTSLETCQTDLAVCQAG